MLRRARDRAGLGECVDVQCLKQRRDVAVAVLRTVVGVEAPEEERERPEQGLEDRHQAGRVEVLDRADELELGNLIDEVQVVQALEAIAVALMNRIDSHVTGLSERLRPAPFADRHLHRARRDRCRPASPLIGRRVPQVVQVAVGDAGQAFEPAVVEQRVGAGTELACGWPGQRAVERVDLGE